MNFQTHPERRNTTLPPSPEVILQAKKFCKDEEGSDKNWISYLPREHMNHTNRPEPLV